MNSQNLSAAIKQCIVDTCRYIKDIRMVELRPTLSVLAKELVGEKEKEPVSYCVQGNQTPIEGFFYWRYQDWSIDLVIEYIKWSPEQILGLLRLAGTHTGIGLGRPARNGNYGTFEVTTQETAL